MRLLPKPASRDQDGSAAAPFPLARRPGLPVGLGEAIWLFVTFRVLYSAFAVLASAMLQLPGPCNYEQAWDHWRSMPPLHQNGLAFRLLGLWQHWDGCWYQKIAAFGYEPGEHSTAFFPLFPLLMRGASIFTAGDLTVGGFVVSGVAYIAAITGLYRLVLLDFDEGVARRTVLYLSVFPAAFFLFATFTEALFLALAVWALSAARRRAWWLAGAMALLASLTRTQGVLLILPLAWEFALDWRRRSPVTGWRFAQRDAVPLLATLAPLYGLLLFTSYSRVFAGETPLAAQGLWQSAFAGPWTVIEQSWQYMRRYGSAVQFLNLALFLLFVALLLVGLRRLPFAYTLYSAPQLLLMGVHTSYQPLQSTLRYLLVLFPAFVVLAIVGKRRRLHESWLIVSVSILVLLLITYLRGDFVA